MSLDSAAASQPPVALSAVTQPSLTWAASNNFARLKRLLDDLHSVSAVSYSIQIVYKDYPFSFETPAEGPTESQVQQASFELANEAASLSRPIYSVAQQHAEQLCQAQRELGTKDALLCQKNRELAMLKQAIAIQKGQLPLQSDSAEIISDLQHSCGEGVYTFADGAVYRGQYKGDKKEGDGVYTFTSDDVYRGQWKGDKREGDGVYTFANGDVYRGQYQGDKKEGDGVYTFASGRRTFDKYKGGKEVSSVPFDATNPAHAAVLRAANEAEARLVGAPHPRRARSAHVMRGADSCERRRSTGESCGGARRASRA